MVMPIFVIVMHALCNACWDLVLSRAAMLIKHVLCLVLSSSYGYYMVAAVVDPENAWFKRRNTSRIAPGSRTKPNSSTTIESTSTFHTIWWLEWPKTSRMLDSVEPTFRTLQDSLWPQQVTPVGRQVSGHINSRTIQACRRLWVRLT